MDYLWTPWRYKYVAEAGKDSGCIFCDLPAAGDDTKTLIIHRAKKNFIILNRFPYTTGHCMIVPFAHVAELSASEPETLSEMMQLAQKMQIALSKAYKPEGYNLGMNLGRCAGAGVTGHLHLHVLPRWAGDSSFMTTVSETRLEPEDLATTFDKLRRALA
ncbi:MAG: HIT domain-containing protein [Acidobacteria bacterium]|nr:HIT domain-containing protein [Acidobacteriota bacterium]